MYTVQGQIVDQWIQFGAEQSLWLDGFRMLVACEHVVTCSFSKIKFLLILLTKCQEDIRKEIERLIRGFLEFVFRGPHKLSEFLRGMDS